MILVCGATGELGGRITRLLVADGQKVRALVRPGSDATALEGQSVEVIRGDLRERASLAPALVGIDTVITTVNSIGRMLAGPTDLTIAAVDGRGTLNLIRAAEEAGVRRFVYVSVAGLGEDLARLSPMMAAKWEAEKALRAVVAAFEKATGRQLKVRHIPRVVMAIGHRALARVKPEVASLMGAALNADRHPSTWDDKPLRQAGIDPRPATAFIRQSSPAR